MALGLPEHLARDALRRAVQRAAHAAAFLCLLTAAFIGTIAVIESGRAIGWIGVGSVLLMIGALVLVGLRPTVISTIAYLVVGGATIFLATVGVMSSDTPFPTSNNIVIALPMVALVLVGGAGTSTALGITWAVLGWAIGQLAAFAGTLVVGARWSLVTAATFSLGVIVVMLIVDRAGARSRGDTVAQGGTGDGELIRASRQTRELALRHDRELRATARLNDIAMTHLVAVASAGSGPVDERLRAEIRRDLALLVGPDWVADQQPEASVSCRRLDQALEAAEQVGLEVRLTGDARALEQVSAARAEALDAAVAQALINVKRHAGVDVAEVAIGAGHGEVTVAVMDTGSGFDEREVPGDRIGLRTSIRGRIERAGGSVQLWSTKGVGTTIVLSVPAEPTS